MGNKRTTAVAKGAATAQPLATTATEPTTAATAAASAAPDAAPLGATASDALSDTPALLSTGTTEAPEHQPEHQPENQAEAEAEAEQPPSRVRVCVLNHSGHALTVKGVTEALASLHLALPPCGKSDSFDIDEQDLPDLEEAVSYAQTSNYLRPGVVQLHIEKAIK